MKKVFITTTPLQVGSALQEQEYIPQQFELKNNRMSRFPIIPIIAEHLEDMGETEIIVIHIDNEAATDNYHLLEQEVASLGLSTECIKRLPVSMDQDPKQQVEMMLQLIDMIPNHSVIRACITYGTKAIPIAVSYALQCIKKVLYDVEVRGIYYGEPLRIDGKIEKGKGKLYDLTNLLTVGEVIEDLNHIGIEDMKSSLKRLFN